MEKSLRWALLTLMSLMVFPTSFGQSLNLTNPPEMFAVVSDWIQVNFPRIIPQGSKYEVKLGNIRVNVRNVVTTNNQVTLEFQVAPVEASGVPGIPAERYTPVLIGYHQVTVLNTGTEGANAVAVGAINVFDKHDIDYINSNKFPDFLELVCNEENQSEYHDNNFSVKSIKVPGCGCTLFAYSYQGQIRTVDQRRQLENSLEALRSKLRASRPNPRILLNTLYRVGGHGAFHPGPDFTELGSNAASSAPNLNGIYGGSHRFPATGALVAVLDTSRLVQDMPGIANASETAFVPSSGDIIDPFDADRVAATYNPKHRTGQGRGHGFPIANLIAEIAGGASVLRLMVCDPIGICPETSVIQAVCYVLSIKQTQPKVLNLSLGSFRPSQALHRILEIAQSAGVVMAAAAGNWERPYQQTYLSLSGGYRQMYPAGFSNPTPYFGETLKSLGAMLGVGSLEAPALRGNQVRIFPHSNSGPHARVFAPGFLIGSIQPNGNRGGYNGTSYATPVVAGVLAAIRTKYPNRPPEDAVSCLLSNTTLNNLKILDGVRMKNIQIGLASGSLCP